MLDNIFIQVLDMSKTSGIVILAVVLTRLLLKKAPKVFSYALWGVVLFRLLCPVTVEAPVSIVPEVTSVSQGYTLSDESISIFGAGEAAYQAVGDVLNGGLGIQHIRTTEKTASGMTRYVTSDWWDVWILFGQYVWIAGIVAMLLYSAVSYLIIRRKLSVVVPLRDNIFIADDIKSPFVVGVFRPKIYLPCNLGEKEQAYIILHEQHHIKRFDHIVKALAFLALTIHWFNPLVWTAFILAGKDMEMSCDEAVIHKLGGEVRADYAASLLTLATGRRIIAGTPLAFGEGDTKGRIKNLSGWNRPKRFICISACVLVIMIAIVLAVDPSGISLSKLTIDEVDMPTVLSDVKSMSVYYNGNTVSCDESETDRFLATMSKIKVKQTPISQSRAENRSRDFVITINGNISLNFNETFSVIWVDTGVKPSLSYQISNPKTAEELVADFNVALKTDGQESNPAVFSGELIPGTTYVSYQCLYMNPLSSYAAFGGDSGCKYIVGEDYFATIYRNNGSFISVTDPNLDTATSGLDGLQNMIDVPKWEWQEFPYTDEEWAALYKLSGFGSIDNISEYFDEMLYQPLTPGKFLLKMDNSLWLVEVSANDPMGTYLCCIYSLVPESAMGMAQWEYAPTLSSRSPCFRFEFDVEHTQITAVCTQSPLVDFDAPGSPSDTSMTFREGNALYWSPVDEDGNVVSAAIILFTVNQDKGMRYSGTIYIEGNSGSNGRRIYNASLVGTGLHLDPNMELGGGIISATDSSAKQTQVTEHDLTTGDLEVPVEALASYVFYTNSKQISVTVTSNADFAGNVNLLDISQNNAQIQQARVNTSEGDCLFTGLTSARLYRIHCAGLEGCTVIISGSN